MPPRTQHEKKFASHDPHTIGQRLFLRPKHGHSKGPLIIGTDWSRLMKEKVVIYKYNRYGDIEEAHGLDVERLKNATATSS